MSSDMHHDVGRVLAVEGLFNVIQNEQPHLNESKTPESPGNLLHAVDETREALASGSTGTYDTIMSMLAPVAPEAICSMDDIIQEDGMSHGNFGRGSAAQTWYFSRLVG
jgi:hypothetical protein